MQAHEKQSKSERFSIVPATWINHQLLTAMTGITNAMAQKYRLRGMWLEGKHWRVNPIGNVVYNWREIDKWNEGA